jgi:hypothetical protein
MYREKSIVYVFLKIPFGSYRQSPLPLGAEPELLY